MRKQQNLGTYHDPVGHIKVPTTYYGRKIARLFTVKKRNFKQSCEEGVKKTKTLDVIELFVHMVQVKLKNNHEVASAVYQISIL